VRIVIFITLGKWRKKPTKELLARANELFEQGAKEGVNFVKMYWALGRYDMIAIAEAKDEKVVMKNLMRLSDLVSTETLVAVPREDAIKLVE
jgi:uncharacterized protein with GYD domain